MSAPTMYPPTATERSGLGGNCSDFLDWLYDLWDSSGRYRGDARHARSEGDS